MKRRIKCIIPDYIFRKAGLPFLCAKTVMRLISEQIP